MDKPNTRESARHNGRGIFAYLWISICTLMAGCIQTGFFAALPIFGTAPDLNLVFVSAVAMKWGAKKGTVAGLSAGIVMSALSPGSHLSLIFYFALGVAIGVLFEASSRGRLLTFLITVGAAALLRMSVTFFELCLFVPTFGFTAALTKLILPNFAATLLFSPLLYPIAAEKRDRSKS